MFTNRLKILNNFKNNTRVSIVNIGAGMVDKLDLKYLFLHSEYIIQSENYFEDVIYKWTTILFKKSLKICDFVNKKVPVLHSVLCCFY